jgi:hypothetical protein
MKYALMSLLLIFSASAFAGTPEQDPIIAQLRARFAKARTPKHYEVGIGDSWDCTFRSALEDDFTTMNVENAYRLYAIYPPGLVVIGNDGRLTLKEIYYTQHGLAGVVPDPNRIYQGLTEIFRIDDNNNLLVELVERGAYYDGYVAALEPITQMPGPKDSYKAVSYRVCHLVKASKQ